MISTANPYRGPSVMPPLGALEDPLRMCSSGSLWTSGVDRHSLKKVWMLFSQLLCARTMIIRSFMSCLDYYNNCQAIWWPWFRWLLVSGLQTEIIYSLRVSRAWGKLVYFPPERPNNRIANFIFALNRSFISSATQP